MKKLSHLNLLLLACILLTACSTKNNQQEDKMNAEKDTLNFSKGFSEVNGINLYYEIYGEGEPLVLIHGGGSTIQTTFGRIIPELAKSYRVIAMDLQNHGRSGFREVPQTFEQDADDVAALVKNLGINKASFFGFSNGGTTSLHIAIRHPQIVTKLIIASAAYRRDGLMEGFFDFMDKGTFNDMPQVYKDVFLEVNPDSTKLLTMFEKDRDRMISFKDMSDDALKKIKAPALVINGDTDVTTIDHAVAMHKLVPGQLAILPGGHGKYMGEIMSAAKDNHDAVYLAAVIKEFLEKK